MSSRWFWLLGVVFLVAPSLSLAQSDDTPILITPQRDYTGNVTATDRNWFYKNPDGTTKPAGGGVYPSVEISDDGDPSNDIQKVVYVRGNSVVVDIKFKDYFNTPGTINGSLTVSDAKFVVDGVEHSISVSGPGSVSIPGNGGSQTVTLTFAGLPNYVAKGQLKFKGEIVLTSAVGIYPVGYRAWGDSGVHQTLETVYITDQSPTGHQSVPWTDLLDFACGWAKGESGNTAVASSLTYGLYWSSLFAYNLGSPGILPQYWDYQYDGKFKLKKVISDWLTPGASGANCVDVSFALQLLCQSVGVAASSKQLFVYDMSSDSIVPFLTNPLCPIGSDATDSNNYWQIAFTMHQQVRLGNHVYDAAIGLHYDLSGSVYKEPVFNWWEASYWQTFGVFPHDVLGLVYRKLRLGNTGPPDYGDGEFTMPGNSGTYYVPNPFFGPAAAPMSSQAVDIIGVK